MEYNWGDKKFGLDDLMITLVLIGFFICFLKFIGVI